MQSLLERFDHIAGIETEKSSLRWLERIAFFFLFLMILSAPHSIAATQIAWLTGMLAWTIRLFIKPRPKLVRTPLDAALWGLFLWTLLSSVCSYAPDISLDKMRNAALFLIFYFILNLVRSKPAAIFLTFALIVSAMANVLWTPLERISGRGVEISGIIPGSPLGSALLLEGDTLLEANKKKIRRPEDLIDEFRQNEIVRVKAYRPDFNFEVDVQRAFLRDGESAVEKLGITGWTRSRNWRSTGFYSFYVTYAEVLQLLASLTFGLFVALAGVRFAGSGGTDLNRKNESKFAVLKSMIFDP